MRVDLSVRPSVFPMPVLMVGTYGEDGKVDVMNAAWCMTCRSDQIALNLMANHKTVKNMRERKAFTVAIADVEHLAEADYVGMVSGNDTPDKFEKSGLHAVQSRNVDAPIIEEFPLAMECELLEIVQNGSIVRVVGKIVNISADEKCLDKNNRPTAEKLNAVLWSTFDGGYYKIGEKIGQNCTEGKKLIK